MLTEYSEYIVLGIGVVIAVIAWALRKEHARIEACEASISVVADRLSEALKDIGENKVADIGHQERMSENHKSLLKADEDRRGDARKIYDKIGSLEKSMYKEIQRLAEKIAGKK